MSDLAARPDEPSVPASTCPERIGHGRRAVLRGAVAVGALGVAGLPLAGCGDDDDEAAAGGGGGDADPAGAGGGSTALTSTADIPVGGGKIFGDAGVVITQPQEGTFKAFDAVCTHEGCQVGAVADGEIRCPCHGSKFSIADGSVLQEPAPAPLPSKQITVADGQITLA